MLSEQSLEQYAALPPLDVLSALETTPYGLSPDDVRSRLARHGPNTLSDPGGTTILRRLARSFANWISAILIVAGLLAFVSDTPLVGWAIIAVALLNGLFTTWQEYLAERAISALRNLMPEDAFVRREGAVQKTPTAEVVPGDILPLNPGTLVVADCYLIATDGLRIKQGILTGNSAPVTKVTGALADPTLPAADRPNLVLAGSTVVEGQGSAVVVATGMRTLLGRIALSTAALGEAASPLARALNALAATISRVAIAAGVITFILTTVTSELDVHDGIIFAIGIIVAFVPEGLLPTVSLALALARRRLQAAGILARRLAGVESLGSTSVLCIDRSEELTAEGLVVQALWAGGRLARAAGDEGLPADALRDAAYLPLLHAAVICNNSRLIRSEEDGGWRILGDRVEGAMLVAAERGGVTPEQTAFARLQFFPQEARRPLTIAVGSEPGLAEAEQAVYVRGAPAAVLERCASERRGDSALPMDDGRRREVLAEADALARQGMRVLALAARRVTTSGAPLRARDLESDLTLLGLVGLQEPPLPAVAALVAGCRRAGIRIILVTGTYALTAEASARKAGLVGGEQIRLVTGADLDELSEPKLQELVATPGETIYAQCDAEQKRRIVAALQAGGEVVAFMGDSINDAPALKQADTGVAIGESSTSVALAAADILLSGRRPDGVLRAVAEGRAIFSNIQKFAAYIFTHNIAETVAVAVAVIFRLPLPLTVLQVLIIDLGTELLPALALSSERPEPGVLDRPPRPRSAPLIDATLLLRTFAWMGLLEGLLALAAYLSVPWGAGWRPGAPLEMPPELYARATTMAYAAIVCGQAGVAFAIRSRRAAIWQLGIFSNRLVPASVLASLALMLLMIYVPPLAQVAGMAAPTPAEWVLLAGCGVVMLVAEEGRKLILRRTRPE